MSNGQNSNNLAAKGAFRSLDHVQHYDRTCLSTHLPEASAKKNRSIRAQKHNDPAAPYREAGSYVQASKGPLTPLSALPSWPREAQPCRRPSHPLQRRLWMHQRLRSKPYLQSTRLHSSTSCASRIPSSALKNN